MLRKARSVFEKMRYNLARGFNPRKVTIQYMKPYRHLYPAICDWENLENAYRRARKGKRGRAPAATFERQLEDNLVALQNDLVQQTYQPGAYHNFYIHEPKRRLISAQASAVDLV